MYAIEHWRMRPDATGLATRFGKAYWGHIAQAAVGPAVIIVRPPTFYKAFCLIDV